MIGDLGNNARNDINAFKLNNNSIEQNEAPVLMDLDEAIEWYEREHSDKPQGNVEQNDAPVMMDVDDECGSYSVPQSHDSNGEIVYITEDPQDDVSYGDNWCVDEEDDACQQDDEVEQSDMQQEEQRGEGMGKPRNLASLLQSDMQQEEQRGEGMGKPRNLASLLQSDMQQEEQRGEGMGKPRNIVSLLQNGQPEVMSSDEAGNHATGNKRDFLEDSNLIFYHSVKLFIPEIQKLADDCHDNHGIKIILSGTTKLGREIIDQMQELQAFSEDDAIREIKKLQSDLGQNEALGYIYLGADQDTDINYLHEDVDDADTSYYHAECFVITKDRIIKPVESRYDVLTDFGDGTVIYTQPRSGKVVPCQAKKAPRSSNDVAVVTNRELDEVQESFPHPQADVYECATLAALTLKTLLKNDAAKLKQSFCFNYHNELTNKTDGVFIPDGSLVKYSQSSSFGCMLLKVVSSTSNSAFLENSSKKAASAKSTYQVRTMKSYAPGSVMPSHTDVNKWLEGYHAADKKRKMMQSSRTGHNESLKYYTYKFSNRLLDDLPDPRSNNQVR